MLNTEMFINRLEQIMENHSLTASGFADKIGIQRSSLSHLMSGRNNPSLDLVMKIVAEFPEADLYWLLLGTGTYPKKNEQASPLPPGEIKEKEIAGSARDLFSELTVEKGGVSVTETKAINAGKEIERIVMFYKNGTFSEYRPN